MITLNGRFCTDRDNYTVISTLGKSVVDYAIVQVDCFDKYTDFQVRTVLDLLEEYSIPTDSSMPDHSLLCWDFRLEQHELVEVPPQHSMPTSQDRPPLRCKPGSAAFKMNSDANRQVLDSLTRDLNSFTNCSPAQLTTDRLEDNYSKFYTLWVEQFGNHRSHHRSNRKPWWNDELSTARKELKNAQKDWIRCQDQLDKKNLWQCYKTKQRCFNLKIRKEKRKFLEQRQERLLLTKVTNTKKFWETFDKIRISNDKRARPKLPERMKKGMAH